MSILDCKQTRTLLMAYLDSELDAVHTLEVGQHLERCSSCRERFGAEQMLETRLREQLRDDPMPDAVWQRITDRLANEANEANDGPAPVRRVRWVPLAAAAVVLLAVGLLLRDSLLHAPAPRGSLAEAFVASHRELLDGARVDLQSESFEELFRAAHLESVPVPGTGRLDNHAVSRLGARSLEITGEHAVNVHFECCGEPVSVFLMNRAQLDDASAVEIDVRDRGLFGHTLNRGDVLVGVVSKHSTPLEHFWEH
ncbi:MAG: hypothetical protein DHS20C15_23550 [Planctomycetota bacterium]|nr:MAG: hypothetical protein DHS20C15_23550 [Planctomycetota bacterium]